jgi:hypothetical protein
MRGGQWQVLRLLEGLAQTGVESVLLARQSAPLFEAARKYCRVEPLSLLRVVREARVCDAIHAHDAASHTIGALQTGIPLLVSRRVAFPPRTRWKYGRAARYIAVSEFVKSVLVKSGVPPDRVDVVYDGVPLLQQATGDTILAPANARDAQKGAALAEEGARQAGVPIRFSVDLEGDLAGASLFVYITKSEGLGSAVLLAMSAGIPVIASDIGGLREVICDGQNGILVENAASAIASALRDLTSNTSLARQLGRAGRQSVEERFTTGVMVDRTIGVYRRVLS